MKPWAIVFICLSLLGQSVLADLPKEILEKVKAATVTVTAYRFQGKALETQSLSPQFLPFLQERGYLRKESSSFTGVCLNPGGHIFTDWSKIKAADFLEVRWASGKILDSFISTKTIRLIDHNELDNVAILALPKLKEPYPFLVFASHGPRVQEQKTLDIIYQHPRYGFFCQELKIDSLAERLNTFDKQKFFLSSKQLNLDVLSGAYLVDEEASVRAACRPGLSEKGTLAFMNSYTFTASLGRLSKDDEKEELLDGVSLREEIDLSGERRLIVHEGESKSGLFLKGDALISVNSKALRSKAQCYEVLRKESLPWHFQLMREDEEVTVSLFPSKILSTLDQQQFFAKKGLVFEGNSLRIKEVKEGSPAARSGLEKGDRLSWSHHQQLYRQSDVYKAYLRSGRLLFLVLREGKEMWLEIK